LRSYALAGALQRQGLDVFVYSLVGRKKDYLGVRPSAVQVWPGGIPEYVDRGLFGFGAQFGSYRVGLPPLWLTAWLRAAARSPGEMLLPARLRERLAWCDALVADFPFVHPVFSAPSAEGALRILSTHNLEHQLFDDQARWKNRRLRPIVRAVELEGAAACDVLVSCCAGDKQFFEANTDVRRSILVPNGIDVRRFRGIEKERVPVRRALGLADDVKVFLFTASQYGPNREAVDYLAAFARARAGWLESERIHILVVGNVVAAPVRRPGFTATGMVEVVEPYFAAADAALNPMATGAGTNVKMCEFIARRLPIVSTPFGTRGFTLEDGESVFLFGPDALAPVLARVRRLFDEDPGRLRQMTETAFARNQRAIDMDTCAQRLVTAIAGTPRRRRTLGRAPRLEARSPSESV
jgi:glycosyltransferase involved in cell wall biosynthesis